MLALFVLGTVGATTVHADQVDFYLNQDVAKTAPCVEFSTALAVTNANQKCNINDKKTVYFHLCKGTVIGDRTIDSPQFTAIATLCATDATIPSVVTAVTPYSQFMNKLYGVTDKLRVKVTDKYVIIDTILGIGVLFVFIKFLTRKKQDV